MSIANMRKELLKWYPWWTLGMTSNNQVMAIYFKDLSKTAEEAFRVYSNKAASYSDLDQQVEIMDIFYNRYDY